MTYQKKPPTLPFFNLGISTCPGISLVKSTADALFAYLRRTSMGRSVGREEEIRLLGCVRNLNETRSRTNVPILNERPHIRNSSLPERQTHDDRGFVHDHICSPHRILREDTQPGLERIPKLVFEPNQYNQCRDERKRQQPPHCTPCLGVCWWR